MTPDQATSEVSIPPPEDPGVAAAPPVDDLERWAPWDGLSDEQGPIPAFGPAKTDKKGRLVMSPEEREARRQASMRMLKVIGTITDETDTDEIWDEVMRALRRDD